MVSRSEWCHNQSHVHDPPCTNNNAQVLMDQARTCQEVELTAQLAAHHELQRNPSTSIEAGMTSRTMGVPCLVSALRNERLPKDFNGPRKVSNYTVNQPQMLGLRATSWPRRC